MENNIIFENKLKETLKQVILEETSKVSRQDFSRVQFKIDELQNSINESIKELRKLEDSVPTGLQNLIKNRISMISSNLSNSQKVLIQLKDKVKHYKRTLYAQSLDEKKKP
jgi:flagellar biosynthesis chaperone FliJ